MSENIHRDEITRSLPVALTPEELNTRLTELASHSLRLEELQEERRRVVGNFNTDIKEERGVIKNLAEATTSQQEHRPGPVIRECNFDTGRVRFIRKDTGEEIEERAMTDEEAQMDLVGGGEGEQPKKRGRPRGSKNKPKEGEEAAARAAAEGANGSGEEAAGGDDDRATSGEWIHCTHCGADTPGTEAGEACKNCGSFATQAGAGGGQPQPELGA